MIYSLFPDSRSYPQLDLRVSGSSVFVDDQNHTLSKIDLQSLRVFTLDTLQLKRYQCYSFVKKDIWCLEMLHFLNMRPMF